MQTATAVSLHFEAIRDKIRPSDWRVQALNPQTGEVFLAIFCGRFAQEHAMEYAAFKNHQQR